MAVIEAPECAPEQRAWGLCYVEHPKLAYARADVFWQAAADPGVLPVERDNNVYEGKRGGHVYSIKAIISPLIEFVTGILGRLEGGLSRPRPSRTP